MPPSVSVILPVYNHGAFVGEAIECVLCQSYSDLELIAIDDCSTDESWSVVQSFTDPRLIKSRNSANRGVSFTYNDALAKSSGSIIMSLGSDDAFAPRKIEEQLKFLNKHPEVSILGTYLTVVGDPEGRTAVREWFNAAVDLNSVDSWIWTNRLAQSSVAITRDAHERLGNSRLDLRRIPDWELWLRAVSTGTRIAVLPEPLTSYRVQAGSVTHASPAETVHEYLTVSMEYWHEFLRTSGRPDLVAANLRYALQRFSQASESGQALVREVLDLLMRREPESLDAVLLLMKEANATLEAKEWLENQWRRQEARAEELEAKLSRLTRKNK